MSSNPTPLRPLLNLNVLLVEDAPDQQRMYAFMLRSAGADVSFECNGQAALKAVTDAATPFDAVIMDLMMPILDGIAATRELRRRGFAGPIIAITAHHRDETQRMWFDAGCNAYLVKPVMLPQLITVLLEHTPQNRRQYQSNSAS